ncbi:MAG: hypothetical protein ABFC67_05895 [Mizugakiibacter sp.]|uniref:CopD family copper resistance protein n=1 Tax=Mizugakiibacter sp. TaxID=1972610 RepID=UPI0031C5BCF0|nr:hypothetical protein [Xanthomonadaceae bacterium]
MAAWYGWIQLVHLACAILFVGAVSFEVLILESLHRHLGHDEMARLEELVLRRARRVMPLAVLLLFASGFAMFAVRCPDFACMDTRFGALLGLKVLLAFGVLGVFLSAMWAGLRGRMSPCRFRYTHRIVFVLMVGIVFLAKGMFLL